MILIFYPTFCDVPEEGSLFSFMTSLRDLNHNPGSVSQLWPCSRGKERRSMCPIPTPHVPQESALCSPSGESAPWQPSLGRLVDRPLGLTAKPAYLFPPSQFKAENSLKASLRSSLPVSWGPYLTSQAPSGNAICFPLFVAKYNFVVTVMRSYLWSRSCDLCCMFSKIMLIYFVGLRIHMRAQQSGYNGGLGMAMGVGFSLPTMWVLGMKLVVGLGSEYSDLLTHLSGSLACFDK